MKYTINKEYSSAKGYANALYFAKQAAEKGIQLTAAQESVLVEARGLIETREATLTKKKLHAQYADYIKKIRATLTDCLTAKDIEKAVEEWTKEFDEYYHNTIGITAGGSRKADPEKVAKRLIHDAGLINIPFGEINDLIEKYKGKN